MPVSNGYRTYIIEQLQALPQLSTRRMFGGLGLYSGAWFFALIDDDVLFFKVDDANRADYQARGMQGFRPFPDRPDVSLGYFQVPPEVIEEAEDLARWARRSIEVAQRAAAKKVRSRKTAEPRSKRALSPRARSRRGGDK
jgi:DNA transformation protein and related proteins